MKNIFNSIKLTKPKTNYFDLTHDVKMSTKVGELAPVMLMECVPGDHVTLGSDLLVRFAPMLAPVMHRFDATIHYFFVPNRILWPKSWERFITGSYLTVGGTDPVWPYVVIDDTQEPGFLRLADYLGLPTPPVGAVPSQVSALPFAAYMKVFAEFYRDQNLDPTVGDDIYPGTELVDGENHSGLFEMKFRAWEHDYFSSALPWAQKGPEVVIPYNQQDQRVIANNGTATTVLTGAPYSIPVDAALSDNPDVAPNQLFVDPEMTADTAPSIDDLRRAFKLKEWLEKNARGGTRYIESILMHFGVKSSDKRLQRPEYITGLKAPVIISEVLNTTGQVDGVPQGTMAGHGISGSAGNVGNYYCEEHGFIIGILSVTPKPAYQQGIPKHFLKNYNEDYFWPSFAHLGEQPVQQQELYAYTPNQFETFGYVPRYAEYKYLPSRVSGEFRTSLAYWHAGRIFETEPALNNNFVTVRPEDVNRIFAVTDPAEDTIFVHCLNKVGARRPMPKYGTPTI